MNPKRLFVYNDFIINTDDADSLHSHNWLTDNIVNFAVTYLANQIFGQEERERHICIVYATQCELLKYHETTNDSLRQLLHEIGVSQERWALFIYNNSSRPDQIYSGTHWSLIVYKPNQPFLLYMDPTQNGIAGADIKSFASKLGAYLGLTSSKNEAIICNYKSSPRMQISGDCGIFVIEYARIIMQAIVSIGSKADPERDFDFYAEPNYLKSGTCGIINARHEWQRIVERLTNDNNF